MSILKESFEILKNRRQTNEEKIGYRHHGKVYYLPNQSKLKFIPTIVLACFFVLAGVLALAFLYRVETTATITSAKQKYDFDDSKYVEVYEYTYDFNDSTYTGDGECNLTYSGDFKYPKGRKIKIYVNPIIPSISGLDNTTIVGLVLVIVLPLFGLSFIASYFILKLKLRKDLKEIGDANGDGKLDANDIMYGESQHFGIPNIDYSKPSAFEIAKRKMETRENTIIENVEDDDYNLNQ